MLRSYLDDFRATILRQAEGLTAEQLAATLGPSTLTLGGIRQTHDLGRELVVGGPGARGRRPSWRGCPRGARGPTTTGSGTRAKDDPWDLLVFPVPGAARAPTRGRLACLRRRRASTCRARVPRPRQSTPRVRWILVHMVEEYARHAGHADLIRESIDG